MPRHKSISDEEILDRALPLTARAGPVGLKLADLARELGVALATLLQRFGDKQTLIERPERTACASASRVVLVALVLESRKTAAAPWSVARHHGGRAGYYPP